MLLNKIKRFINKLKRIKNNNRDTQKNKVRKMKVYTHDSCFKEYFSNKINI